VEVFDDRICQLGEGPYYDDRSGRVGWVDILGRSVLWRALGTGETGAIPVEGHIGAAVPRERGGLVLCLPTGPVLLDPDGGEHRLAGFTEADAAAGRPRPVAAPAVRGNDAKADPYGRLWLGTMAYNETAGAGALYRLEPEGSTPLRVLDGVTVSNGLGWSPDGSLMYYVDSPTRRIDVFDYRGPTGAVAGRRPFAAIEAGAGFPDGLCVDAAGGVWVALWGGGALRRYTPDGSLDRVLEVGTAQVTSCAFAGPGYEDLIITTAGRHRPDPGAGLTYVHRPGDVVGAPVHRFAG
jgi:sugar lactone lactonase YvrE